jgi:hypothetical protein
MIKIKKKTRRYLDFLESKALPDFKWLSKLKLPGLLALFFFVKSN